MGDVDRGTALRLLALARELTEPELRKAVDRLPDPVRRLTGYHFGWWDESGARVRANGGKRVRAALALASAQALGARPERAVTVAAAVELVHNFSVVHDDLMDGDATRRGRRTAWTAFGEPLAILGGDALLALAIDVVRPELAGSAGQAIMKELSDALLKLVAGQTADLALEGCSEIGLAECLTMAGDKTASLMAAACALGALSAGADADQVSRMRRLGWHLGLSFQLADDLLGIWGDAQVTGKPVGGDLRRRKKSLPVVAALSSATTAGDQLAEFYHGIGPMPEAEIRQAVSLIEEAGGRRWAEQESIRQRTHAFRELTALSPEPGGARALVALSYLMTHREH
ncbi:polyprenyl synthetase family protein [Nonomuraea longispora]|uniref:Polyprenyl synthetase family protein n=1 Tax=Nonomuraea longispora TaxID=1848320 RepID=A0A4R4N310_9ACTN|nr:polyprenyl synthetase family protein [Nonomuraea longispora]TDC01147.1 polyprenyl synthetase family protein [Nonomuraea longispora]